MPREMTMHQPNARIIRPERQRQVPTRIQQRDIPTRGIIKVEFGNVSLGVERLVLLREDDEVVAVQVDGVGGGRGTFQVTQVLARDDEVDEPLGEVVVYDGVVGTESLVGRGEDGRVGVVQEQGRVGEVPTEEATVGGGGAADVGFEGEV